MAIKFLNTIAVDTDVLYVDASSNNVGIGTTSPDSTLHVESTGTTIGGYKYHTIVDDNNTYGINNGGGIVFRGNYNSSGAKANFGAIRSGKSNSNDGNANAYLSFYYGASGTLAEGIRLDYNGNVGIGTTSPSAKLDVSANANDGIRLAANNALIGAAAGGDTQLIYWNGSVAFYGRDALGGSVTQHQFRTSGTTRVLIDSTGNVGIGTTSPQRELEVTGTGNVYIRVTAPTSNDSSAIELVNTTETWTIRNDDTNDNALEFQSDAGSPQVTMLRTGNVGIGTTSPGYTLDVNGTLHSSNITLADGIYHEGDTNTYINFLSDQIQMATAGSVRAYINSSGNVGIGTTSPASGYKLDVNGLGAFNTAISIQGVDTGNPTAANEEIRLSGYGIMGSRGSFYITNANASGAMFFGIGGAHNNSTKMTINSSGNVGIGTTSPGVKLDVSGQIRSNDSFLLQSGTTAIGSIRNQGGALDIRGDSSRDVSLGSVTNPQALFVEGTNGNVGIGTTSPTYKLDVIGGARAGGVVTYSKTYTSLDTTGNAVAGLTTGGNGNSAGFTFTCFGHGEYQKVVYSCYNASGTWNTIKVIDEGTNAFDVEASANATTITFTFKTVTGTKNYQPRVTVEATGSAINSTYA